VALEEIGSESVETKFFGGHIVDSHNVLGANSGKGTHCGVRRASPARYTAPLRWQKGLSLRKCILGAAVSTDKPSSTQTTTMCKHISSSLSAKDKPWRRPAPAQGVATLSCFSFLPTGSHFLILTGKPEGVRSLIQGLTPYKKF
jgi:hypothetical protein